MQRAVGLSRLLRRPHTHSEVFAAVIRATRTRDGGAIVEAELVRQPAIYLDQDSLGDIARYEPRRKRFLEIFRNKDTLLFSWTNAFDIAGPRMDATKRRIREFLDALGSYWLPLELNPYKVARKEQDLKVAPARRGYPSRSFVAITPSSAGVGPHSPK